MRRNILVVEIGAGVNGGPFLGTAQRTKAG